MLQNEKDLTRFISTNQSRLAEAYRFATSWLRQRNIPYLPAYAGHFIFIDLRKFLPQSDPKGAKITEPAQQEAQLWLTLLADGVYLAPGAFYGHSEPGWFRLTFVSFPDSAKTLN